MTASHFLGRNLLRSMQMARGLLHMESTSQWNMQRRFTNISGLVSLFISNSGAQEQGPMLMPKGMEILSL